MKHMPHKSSPAGAETPHPPSEQMIETVYDTLRSIAHRERLRNPSYTLNTTVLVHEAWLKLGGQAQQWNDNRHCLGTYAMAIRQVLVDYVRSNLALKRTPTEAYQQFQIEALGEQTAEDLLIVDQALTRLERLEARLARIVELRFFVGLTVDEIAEHLGLSNRTVARDWNRARAFLQVHQHEPE